MMHINVSRVAGQGLKHRNKGVHIGKSTNEAKVDFKVILIEASPHAGGIPRITGKPPACFELFYRLSVLEALNTLLQFQNAHAPLLLGRWRTIDPWPTRARDCVGKGQEGIGV